MNKIMNDKRSYLFLAFVCLVIGLVTAQKGYVHKDDPTKSTAMCIATLGAIIFICASIKSYLIKSGKSH